VHHLIELINDRIISSSDPSVGSVWKEGGSTCRLLPDIIVHAIIPASGEIEARGL
jgi:hypothetical protein